MRTPGGTGGSGRARSVLRAASGARRRAVAAAARPSWRQSRGSSPFPCQACAELNYAKRLQAHTRARRLAPSPPPSPHLSTPQHATRPLRTGAAPPAAPRAAPTERRLARARVRGHWGPRAHRLRDRAQAAARRRVRAHHDALPARRRGALRGRGRLRAARAGGTRRPRRLRTPAPPARPVRLPRRGLAPSDRSASSAAVAACDGRRRRSPQTVFKSEVPHLRASGSGAAGWRSAGRLSSRT